MVCGQLGEGSTQFTLSYPLLLLILLICCKCHLFGRAFLDHVFSVGALPPSSSTAPVHHSHNAFLNLWGCIYLLVCLLLCIFPTYELPGIRVTSVLFILSNSVPGTLDMHRQILLGTSLVVQWLRLHTPNAGGPGLIPGQGSRSHILQLRVHMLQLRPSAVK